MQEILEPETREKIKESIKKATPSFIHSIFDNSENLGQTVHIAATFQEFNEKKITLGQIVKLDMPSKISDIIISESNVNE